MSIEEILTNLWNYISNFWNTLLNFLVKIWEFFSSISDAIINVSSYIISIFWFLFYTLKTLLSWVWRLIVYVIQWNVWFDSISAMTKVSDFIGFPATMFIFAMLLLIIAKILISFITKLFKLWTDYKIKRSTWDSKFGKSF